MLNSHYEGNTDDDVDDDDVDDDVGDNDVD